MGRLVGLVVWFGWFDWFGWCVWLVGMIGLVGLVGMYSRDLSWKESAVRRASIVLPKIIPLSARRLVLFTNETEFEVQKSNLLTSAMSVMFPI